MEPCCANVYGLADAANALPRWAGACRYADSMALEQRREFGRPGRKIADLPQHSELSALRNKVDWRKGVRALQMAVWAIDRALQRYLCDLGRHPKVGRIKLRGWCPLGGEVHSIPARYQAGHCYASPAWRKQVPTPAPSKLPTGWACFRRRLAANSTNAVGSLR
ncbi:MAG: hypothetical protein J2P50_12265 [Hyphomicrobiaceae bacterium]|nr:hypothetical protein [Hyphomicrobiaceae bacterium]